jgi:hypothetical protein
MSSISWDDISAADSIDLSSSSSCESQLRAKWSANDSVFQIVDTFRNLRSELLVTSNSAADTNDYSRISLKVLQKSYKPSHSLQTSVDSKPKEDKWIQSVESICQALRHDMLKSSRSASAASSASGTPMTSADAPAAQPYIIGSEPEPPLRHQIESELDAHSFNPRASRMGSIPSSIQPTKLFSTPSSAIPPAPPATAAAAAAASKTVAVVSPDEDSSYQPDPKPSSAANDWQLPQKSKPADHTRIPTVSPEYPLEYHSLANSSSFLPTQVQGKGRGIIGSMLAREDPERLAGWKGG